MLTPEAINDRLLRQVALLEREVAELQAKAGMGKPEVPSVDRIGRVRRAAHDALVARARGLEGDEADRATAIAGEFLQVFDLLVAAAKA